MGNVRILLEPTGHYHIYSHAILKESFQRKRIDDSKYLIQLICYVHNNPVEHGFSAAPEQWRYSSYNAILSESKTHVKREDVLDIFGGKDNFVFLHRANDGFK